VSLTPTHGVDVGDPAAVALLLVAACLAIYRGGETLPDQRLVWPSWSWCAGAPAMASSAAVITRVLWTPTGSGRGCLGRQPGRSLQGYVEDQQHCPNRHDRNATNLIPQDQPKDQSWDPPWHPLLPLNRWPMQRVVESV
jgi:hypothetical protein